MNKITPDQMRTMKYGIHNVGCNTHGKLRYKSALVDRMLKDPELRPYLNDLTVMFNKARTHGHIAFIVHQNANLGQLLYRVEQRQRSKMKMEEAELKMALLN